GFINLDHVYRSQSDERNAADLSIDVVGIGPNEYAHQRSEQAERHGQHNGEWDRPALVLGRQKQKHEDRGEAENETFFTFRKLLLKNSTCPLEAESLRQVRFRDLFHRCRRLSGTETRRAL